MYDYQTVALSLYAVVVCAFLFISLTIAAVLYPELCRLEIL